MAWRVLVKDLFLFVGHFLEAGEEVVDIRIGKIVAQTFHLFTEGVAAGVFAQDQVAFVNADILGPHDFIGAGFLEHAVLMDPGLMGK